MTAIRLVVTESPAALLARAARGLFPLAPSSASNPWPTLPAWVVLRQGGLRDDFHALAASHNVPGWFDSPVCLFAELASRWGTNAAPALTHEERIALLTGLLGARGRGFFDRHGNSDAWVPTVDRLLRELISEGIAPADFRRAVSARTNVDAFAQQRDNVLTELYDDWHATLTRIGRVDGRDALVRLAATITNDPAGFAERLGHRRDVRIVGLADLRGGWTALLRALASSPAIDSIELHVSHALALPADIPVELETAATAPDPSRPSIRLLEAPDVARETELIAVRVRALVDDGVPPSRIAVLYREARPGVDAMASALSALGVPVTARRRTALATSGPARAVAALLGGVTAQWSRHALLEIVEQPLLDTGLNADVLDSAARLELVTDLAGWPSALERLRTLCRSRDAGTLRGRPRVPLPATSRVEATIAAWPRWTALASALEQPRPMRAWFAWLQSLLQSAEWGVDTALATAPAGDMHAWRVDVKARDMLLTLARAWQSALDTFGEQQANVGADVFRTRLALLLDADVITQPETGFGVVVSEALAGAWRAFDLVFVCGLTAGAFPLRVSANVLLPDAERRELCEAGLALDAAGAWRGREQALFRVLCAAPRDSLTLSWPAMDADGREVVRSVYVDDVVDTLLSARDADDEAVLEADGTLLRVAPQQVVTPHFPLLPRDDLQIAVAHAQAMTDREAARTREPSAFNGDIGDESLLTHLRAKFDERFIWSATQLEGLAKCAWSWFAERLLNLGERAEASDAIDASATGSILHEALDHFFASARRDLAVNAVYLLPSDAAWVAEQAEASLEYAWNAQAEAQWLGNPALHGIVRAELSALMHGYLAFEMEFNAKSDDNRTTASKQIRTGAANGEFEFHDVELSGADTTFRLRGSIDRVDSGMDDRIDGAEQYFAAIDYKSSVGSTPGGGKAAAWDDGVVLQVPLYAAVLRKQLPDLKLARLEYRTLRKPAVVHRLQFVGVKAAKGQDALLVEDADAESKMQRALDAAGERVAAVRSGVLPTNPTDSCGCSPYCPALDICRIPGGPVSTDNR